MTSSARRGSLPRREALEQIMRTIGPARLPDGTHREIARFSTLIPQLVPSNSET